MVSKMGFFFSGVPWKRKNRWKFIIPGIVSSEDIAANVLPPLKSARPSITFKEQTVEHVIETIYLPGKPDWSTLDITLYDLKCGQNPIFDWLKRLYNPQKGTYGFLLNQDNSKSFKIPEAHLSVVNGVGESLEVWVYEGVWVQKIDWGELDMGSSDVITVDLSLRYDRAWFVDSDDLAATNADSAVTPSAGSCMSGNIPSLPTNTIAINTPSN